MFAVFILYDLGSLIQDRALNLMDGTRLLDMKRYEEIKATASLSDNDMTERYFTNMLQ